MFWSKIKNSLFILTIILSSFSNQVISQSNPNLGFYPLHIGDIWQYNVVFDTIPENEDTTYNSITQVIGKEVFNGQSYFVIDNSNGPTRYLRIDSTDATLWEYHGGSECMIDSLSMDVNEFGFESECAAILCMKDTVSTFFEEEKRTKTFRTSFVVTVGNTKKYKYAFGLGEVFNENTEINVWADVTTKTLVYAKIDGVEYGESVPDTVNTDFLPLEIGNKWVYNHSGVEYDLIPHHFNYDFIWEIVSDTVKSEGDRYFKVTDRFGQFFWLRKDTVSNSIYRKLNLANDYECLFADFFITFTENFEVCNGITRNIVNSDTLIWGDVRLRKEFYYESINTYEEHFVNGIGIVKKKNEFDFGNSTTYLKGCIIDGVLYGDTTLTSVDLEPNGLPTKYSLSQNYPNPFNPSTTINYSIPIGVLNSAVTTLKVYDVLGCEVATLVNKEQKAGSYQVTFDANKLTSGIYFYSLKSDNYFESRKMILIK